MRAALGLPKRRRRSGVHDGEMSLHLVSSSGLPEPEQISMQSLTRANRLGVAQARVLL